LGVIESIWRGFEIVRGRLWLIVPSVLLDLFLWLGPHLSLRPLMESFIGRFSDPTNPAAATAEASLRAFGEQLNLFSLLSPGPLGVPRLMGMQGTLSPAQDSIALLDLTSLWQFGLVLILLPLVGLLVGSIYLGAIGQIVRDGQFDVRKLVQRVWGIWLRMVLLVIAVACLLVALALPILVFASVLVNVGLDALAIVVFMVWLSMAVWVIIYLAFTVHGVILRGEGLLRAMWESVRLVQWSLYPTLGLFAAATVLSIGLSVLFNLPGPDSWLELAGIAGNAFVNTGLAAATFIFYQDRYRRWRAAQNAANERAARQTLRIK
jgi:hypothetical protein